MTQPRQLSEADILKIEKLVDKFTADTLGDECPINMCFQVCYPLYLHLLNNDIPNSLRNGACENRNHYWLNLEDNDEIIIDPTIRQFVFAKHMPSIHKGMKPSCFTEHFGFNFTAVYPTNAVVANMTDKLLTNFINSDRSKEEGIDLDSLRRIILRAGTIINNEMEALENKAGFIKTKRHLEYIEAVYVLLCKYTTDKQRAEFSDLKGFNNLCLKAKCK